MTQTALRTFRFVRLALMAGVGFPFILASNAFAQLPAPAVPAEPGAAAPSTAEVERVIVTGFVDEPTLAALYAGAECLLHAAFLEGFGLTALEALAAGTPVVGYAGGAVAEVVGDAGLLVPSGDEDALASALGRFLDDDALSAALRGRARARASSFSWDRAADETLAVYRSVAR